MVRQRADTSLTAEGMSRGGMLSGVRLWSALATAAIHLVGLAAAVGWGHSRVPTPHGARPNLTVVNLPAHAPAEPKHSTGKPRSETVAARTSNGEGRATAALSANAAPSTAPSNALPTVALVVPTPVVPAVKPAEPPRAAAPARDDGYRNQLWRHIVQRRPYGITLRGTTTVRFRITSAGVLLDAEIVESSGLVNLDRIALRMIRQASPMPRPPAELSESGLDFTIPIVFR